ncbi:hypothetical protein FB639_005714, partial [Coemansia asiatica]
NMEKLFLKLAEEAVPGITEIATRMTISSEMEKQLVADTKKLEDMGNQCQENKTHRKELEKELQQLQEEGDKIDKAIHAQLETVKKAKQRVTEQVQGKETSRTMESAQTQIETMTKQIAKAQPIMPGQGSWAEITCCTVAPANRKIMRGGPAAYVMNHPENMSAEQREDAITEYEIPAWAEGMPFINLTISGITGGMSRPVGSVRGFLQNHVGSELRLLWVERATAATVELLVPADQWAVTCKYLAENGVWIHHQLDPTGSRPGGAASAVRAHREAWERWTNWAAGEPNRPFTKLGKTLLQKFPLEQSAAKAIEPRRFAQSQVSEPGEITDRSLTAPEQGWTNATPKS